MRLENGLGALAYCQNIHPAESWAAARAALTGPTARVKASLSPEAPFTVGLRLSAEAVAELAHPAARAELMRVLTEQGYEGPTVNGFPYGPFHGTRVKEDVYQPDWRTDARVQYTCALADLMADIAIAQDAPASETISLSTVPGAFKPRGVGYEAAMAENLLRATAHCISLRERTGRTVALAIEPEPFCFLETIDETVAFFEGHLFSEAAAQRIAALTGLPLAKARAALPRHLGLCYDVCHAAVEFEDPAESVATLRRVGIPVHKLQLSAALRLPAATPAALSALAAFAEPTYLHQVVSRRPDGSLRREADLPQALARAAAAGDVSDEEWRVHFHVPLFVERLDAFETTQPFLAEILAIHAKEPISAHLEIETYTWDVLPPELRDRPIHEAISAEMRWVLERLAA